MKAKACWDGAAEALDRAMGEKPPGIVTEKYNKKTKPPGNYSRAVCWNFTNKLELI
jgi:hypothetical protein